jgi:hypothetical protein
MYRKIGNVMTVILFTFIALKVLGVLTLDWIWVLAPFWIPLVCALSYKLFEYINDTPVSE